jgi:hypothetical protein
MADRQHYFVHAHQTAGLWAISVPELPGVRAETRAKDEIEIIARTAIASELGISENSFDVVLLPNLSEEEARAQAIALITEELHRRHADEADPLPGDWESLDRATQDKFMARWATGMQLMNDTFYGSSSLSNETDRTMGLKVAQALVGIAAILVTFLAAQDDDAEPLEYLRRLVEAMSDDPDEDSQGDD